MKDRKRKRIVCHSRLMWILLAGALCGCHPSALTKPALQNYIDTHASVSPQQTIKGLRMQLRYVPSSLMAAQELEGYPKERQDNHRKDSLEKKYAGQYYFRLELSINHKEAIRQLGSFDRYSDMLQVLSFDMGKYVHCLTDNKDTLSLKDYAFEQTFGMTDANNLLLAFDATPIKASKTFTVKVSECGFGVGDADFKFRTKDIESVPALKTGDGQETK